MIGLEDLERSVDDILFVLCSYFYYICIEMKS